MGTPDSDEQIDGRRVRWEEHKRERRNTILAAAVELIEEHPPGEEIHIQQIAARAGIARPAVYRHFTDRHELDLAVQKRALALLMAELNPQVVLTGTIEQVIRRIIETYVTWAGDHPALHRVAVREGVSQPNSPVRVAVLQVADLVIPLIEAGASTFGATLDEDDRAALDLLVFGMVSQAVGAVRLWLGREARSPSAGALASRLAEVIWFQLDGLARARGATIDPTQSIEQILALALGRAADD